MGYLRVPTEIEEAGELAVAPANGIISPAPKDEVKAVE